MKEPRLWSRSSLLDSNHSQPGSPTNESLREKHLANGSTPLKRPFKKRVTLGCIPSRYTRNSDSESNTHSLRKTAGLSLESREVNIPYLFEILDGFIFMVFQPGKCFCFLPVTNSEKH
jgi:hypothetical protein